MNAYSSPQTLSRTTLPVPLAALLTGVVLSAGVMALADSDDVTTPPAKVIVVEAPASPGQGVSATDEARVASAIAVGPQLRGSKASATGVTSSSVVPQTGESRPAGPRVSASSSTAPQTRDSRPAGPRGLASSLSNR